MIRNNDIIQGYTVLMVANGMILAHSKTAPDPYVVWHTAENGNDVYDGKYLPNKEDAEIWKCCRKSDFVRVSRTIQECRVGRNVCERQ